MLSTLGGLLVIAYLPGALLYRLPTRDRGWRSGRSAEERVFWAVMLSVVVSSFVVLTLALAGVYRYERLLLVNGLMALTTVAAARGRLRFGPGTPRPGWTAVIPAAIVGLGLWLYFPPAEYLMGGRDPGVYMHEGIQIAQRGSLVTTDAVAASVPPAARDLFFPDHERPGYYSVRFMGFFLNDPETGAVVGQFPHLYPAWIAVGYGLDGLTGARRMVGWWAILGLLAVYFAGVRAVGRPAAAAAAGLLAVNVVQVWFARYPNSEVVLQALVFAAVLAHAYAHERDEAAGGRFFALVAAALLGMLLFVRLPAIIGVSAAVGATLLLPVRHRRFYVTFGVTLAGLMALALVYYRTLLAPYFARPVAYVEALEPMHLALWTLAAAAGLVVLWAAHRPGVAEPLRRRFPTALIAAATVGAVYTYFFREPGGRLAPQDAYAVRQLAEFYLTPVGFAAGIVGYALVVRRALWRNAALILVVTAFAAFYLYKMRIFPEHFWTARRYLPAILPALILFAGGAAFAPLAAAGRRLTRAVAFVVGVALCGLLAGRYWIDTRAIASHVEFAGLIPRLEQLAGQIGDDDLLIVEAREASDVHVLALPLAYTYARHVLVLYRARPEPRAFREFLTWAKGRYRRVLFMGGGGTELLSRSISVVPLAGEQFQVPEVENALLAYPRAIRYKEFDFGLYELLPQPPTATGFDLDVGTMDDLYLRRFHAKETHTNGMSFRWSRDRSFVSLVGLTPHTRRLTIWMTDGGRPATVAPARVRLTVDGHEIGVATIQPDVTEYEFEIPRRIARELATRESTGQLQLTTRTWTPADVFVGGDAREMGVMVDRIALDVSEPGR